MPALGRSFQHSTNPTADSATTQALSGFLGNTESATGIYPFGIDTSNTTGLSRVFAPQILDADRTYGWNDPDLNEVLIDYQGELVNPMLKGLNKLGLSDDTNVADSPGGQKLVEGLSTDPRYAERLSHIEGFGFEDEFGNIVHDQGLLRRAGQGVPMIPSTVIDRGSSRITGAGFQGQPLKVANWAENMWRGEEADKKAFSEGDSGAIKNVIDWQNRVRSPGNQLEYNAFNYTFPVSPYQPSWSVDEQQHAEATGGLPSYATISRSPTEPPFIPEVFGTKPSSDVAPIFDLSGIDRGDYDHLAAVNNRSIVSIQSIEDILQNNPGILIEREPANKQTWFPASTSSGVISGEDPAPIDWRTILGINPTPDIPWRETLGIQPGPGGPVRLDPGRRRTSLDRYTKPEVDTDDFIINNLIDAVSRVGQPGPGGPAVSRTTSQSAPPVRESEPEQDDSSNEGQVEEEEEVVVQTKPRKKPTRKKKKKTTTALIAETKTKRKTATVAKDTAARLQSITDSLVSRIMAESGKSRNNLAYDDKKTISRSQSTADRKKKEAQELARAANIAAEKSLESAMGSANYAAYQGRGAR